MGAFDCWNAELVNTRLGIDMNDLEKEEEVGEEMVWAKFWLEERREEGGKGGGFVRRLLRRNEKRDASNVARGKGKGFRLWSRGRSSQ